MITYQIVGSSHTVYLNPLAERVDTRCGSVRVTPVIRVGVPRKSDLLKNIIVEHMIN